MKTALEILALWALIAIPAAIIVGLCIRNGSGT